MTAFRDALDLVRLPAPEVAELFGVQPQTVRQMRLDPGHVNYRSPPAGWQSVLAKLARKRAAELVRLADKLEATRA
jgi:hypothetical protein